MYIFFFFFLVYCFVKFLKIMVKQMIATKSIMHYIKKSKNKQTEIVKTFRVIVKSFMVMKHLWKSDQQ